MQNSDAPEREARQLEEAIAGRVRRARLAKGWTLDRLAEVTGLSKGYLSQIENCEKTPTISTLTKVAYGLGMAATELIAGESAPASRHLAIVRPWDRREVTLPGTALGYRYESVSHPKPDGAFDVYLLSLGPEEPAEPLIHDGQELVYVLDGVMELTYEGETYRAEAGDCLYFDSDRPHAGRSAGKEPARVLLVFANPKRK